MLVPTTMHPFPSALSQHGRLGCQSWYVSLYQCAIRRMRRYFNHSTPSYTMAFSWLDAFLAGKTKSPCNLCFLLSSNLSSFLLWQLNCKSWKVYIGFWPRFNLPRRKLSTSAISLYKNFDKISVPTFLFFPILMFYCLEALGPIIVPMVLVRILLK